MHINEISFGNPTYEQRYLIGKESYLNDLFSELILEPMPSNDSEITKQELNEISDRLNDIADTQNQSHLKRYLFADQNFQQFIFNSLRTDKIDVPELSKKIIEDVDPLIVKLKFKYQRPRPKTLAHYYKLNLFPLNKFKADSPSFPSRTVILGFLICNVIGSSDTEIYQKSQSLIDYISQSRSYIGANYESDIAYGIKVGETILKHKAFTEKYNI